MNEEEKEIAIATEKLEQMMSLYYLSLPHDEAEKSGWTIKGMQFHTFFEQIFATIKENFKRNPDAMYSYMELLYNCLGYVLENTEYWPDQDDRDNMQAIIHYNQMKRYAKHPERSPIKLIEENGKIKGEINHAYFDMSKKK